MSDTERGEHAGPGSCLREWLGELSRQVGRVGQDGRVLCERPANRSADDIARIARVLLDPAYEWINGATIPAERGAITYGGLSKLGLG